MRLSETSPRRFIAYPTTRGIAVMAAGIPLALLLATLQPQLAGIGVFFIFLAIGLIIADGLLAAPLSAVDIDPAWPTLLYVDDVIDIPLEVIVEGSKRPNFIEIRLESDERLTLFPHHFTIDGGQDEDVLGTPISVTTHRRGEANIQSVWARWTGPFGLVYKQNMWADVIALPIVPNIKHVTQEALRFFSRDAVHGEKIQLDRGEGTEFESLRDFVKGMDVRDIDWKHSAKHRTLMAKEFRTERNHNIIFAFDRGRLMCEPLDGVPKIDRMINAALLLAYVALKTGDKVGVYSFAAKPSAFSRPTTGLGSFAHVQKQFAEIDYAIVETNFTLGLARLSQAVKRRSLIIIFTDFIDTTTAELMLENVTRLMKKHVVIFATFKDFSLTQVTEKDPLHSDDVSRAVIAGSLLTEREKVLARLKRMGVHVLELTPDSASSRLLNSYLTLRQREEI